MNELTNRIQESYKNVFNDLLKSKRFISQPESVQPIFSRGYFRLLENFLVITRQTKRFENIARNSNNKEALAQIENNKILLNEAYNLLGGVAESVRTKEYERKMKEFKEIL